MQKLTSFLLFATFLFGLNSCYTQKDTVYFQDIDKKNDTPMAASYETVIRKNDQLQIMVTAIDKAVAQPFNLSLSENLSTNTSQSLISYTVDQTGEIDFPVLGKIKAEGLTRAQLKEYLTERLSEYIKDPIIIITFDNFRVAIMGDVRSPGAYTMPTERTTVLQALAMAGDLNLTARRNDILLIRETEGKLTSNRIDLRNSDIFSSNHYYLQQNDILYITPSVNKVRLTNISSYTTMFGILTSAVALVVSIFNLVK